MRDLHDILEKALHNSAYCDDCPNHTPHKEVCDIPQHQGAYTKYSCRVAETKGDPKECPEVQEYLQQYQAYKDSISMADICQKDEKVLLRITDVEAAFEVEYSDCYEANQEIANAAKMLVEAINAAREQMVDEEV